MFKYMVDVNRLKPVFEKYGLIEEDRVCIEELILGQPRTRRAERAEVMGNFEIYCNFQIIKLSSLFKFDPFALWLVASYPSRHPF